MGLLKNVGKLYNLLFSETVNCANSEKILVIKNIFYRFVNIFYK